MSSIRMKLLVIILSLMVGSLGVLAGLSYYFSKQALTKSVEATAMAIGTDYAKRTAASTNELVIQLQDLASIQRLRSANDNQLIVALVSANNTRTPHKPCIFKIYLGTTNAISSMRKCS